MLPGRDCASLSILEFAGKNFNPIDKVHDGRNDQGYKQNRQDQHRNALADIPDVKLVDSKGSEETRKNESCRA